MTATNSGRESYIKLLDGVATFIEVEALARLANNDPEAAEALQVSVAPLRGLSLMVGLVHDAHDMDPDARGRVEQRVLHQLRNGFPTSKQTAIHSAGPDA